MRIAFVTADWAHDGTLGGAGEARIGLPSRALAEAGHEVYVGELVGQHRDGWLTAIGRDGGCWNERPDVVVIQRWMHKDAPRLQAEARATGQVIVHDLDDWFWGLDPQNRAFWGTHPSTNPDQNRDHYWRALGEADVVTVSTPYLAERLSGIARTEVVRNAIDLKRFSEVREENSTREPERLVYAWVGALGWRSGDLETLRGTIGPVLDEVDGLFLHCGASKATDTTTAWWLMGIPEERVLGWRTMVPSTHYQGLLAGIDVGIVPLADIPFNRAKSAIKGMEYAAAGVPFAAQATDEYRWFGAGATCRRPRDWARALTRMAEASVRLEMREAALERVSAEDVSVRWGDWEDLYSSLLG